MRTLAVALVAALLLVTACGRVERPTGSFVDDTFDDFKQGELSESGAKIYVSAKGNVQLLDRLDLDGDGHLDLAFNGCPSSDGKSYACVYWGPDFATGDRTMIAEKNPNGMAMADLDDDGYVDLIITNQSSDAGTVIHWGSAAGISSRETELASTNATGVSAADLDGDGYLDLVISNHLTGAKTYARSSYVYWGSGSGFQKRTDLPTSGATGRAIADLDGDGRLDIVFANFRNNDDNSDINSYVYWGSPRGFSEADRAELATHGAQDVSVADVDGDKNLDVVFSNGGDGVTASLVYLGPLSNTSGKSITLPSSTASGVSVADLNLDGFLDVVISNYQSGDSYVYWGSAGFSASSRTSLATIYPSGNLVADFDGDGCPDVVFSNNKDAQGAYTLMDSYLYLGQCSSGSWTVHERKDLPTLGTGVMISADPGAVTDRKPTQTFTARAFDAGEGTAPAWGTLAITATIPKSARPASTWLRLQLRSASTKEALETAPFHGPTSTSDSYEVATGSSEAQEINPVHMGDRFLQYRATFSSDFGGTPVLDRVEITWY
jgi:hypothetical protein